MRQRNPEEDTAGSCFFIPRAVKPSQFHPKSLVLGRRIRIFKASLWSTVQPRSCLGCTPIAAAKPDTYAVRRRLLNRGQILDKIAKDGYKYSPVFVQRLLPQCLRLRPAQLALAQCPQSHPVKLPLSHSLLLIPIQQMQPVAPVTTYKQKDTSVC
ncbi:hypothetical protein PoB_002700800 [Plakobranchus ocellatus]|uniref:Uncharacterized protein n=1 Tax=Plakobranchus ocellatus TaxID=259542 RepID=A0AAV4A034_9GAST|nr:hypothetical protein PoB_002700800 [Plakobranchus ocellatus]